MKGHIPILLATAVLANHHPLIRNASAVSNDTLSKTPAPPLAESSRYRLSKDGVCLNQGVTPKVLEHQTFASCLCIASCINDFENLKTLLPRVELHPKVDNIVHGKRQPEINNIERVFKDNLIPLGMLDPLLKLASFPKIEFVFSYSSSSLMYDYFYDHVDHLKTIILLLFPALPGKGRKITINIVNLAEVKTFTNSLDGVWNYLESCKTKGFRDFRPVSTYKWIKFTKGRQATFVLGAYGNFYPQLGTGEKDKVDRVFSSRRHVSSDYPVTFISSTVEIPYTIEHIRYLIPGANTERAKYENVALIMPRSSEALALGGVIPGTDGLHLVASLTAAISDAVQQLFEPLPLTKPTLEEIMGIKYSAKDYSFYYENYVRKLWRLQRVKSEELQTLQSINFEKLQDLFELAKTNENEISEIKEDIQMIRYPGSFERIPFEQQKERSYQSRMRQFKRDVHPMFYHATFILKVTRGPKLLQEV